MKFSRILSILRAVAFVAVLGFASRAVAANLLYSEQTQSFSLGGSTTITIHGNGLQYSTGSWAGVPTAQIQITGSTVATLSVSGPSGATSATAGSASRSGIYGVQQTDVTWTITLGAGSYTVTWYGAYGNNLHTGDCNDLDWNAGVTSITGLATAVSFAVSPTAFTYNGGAQGPNANPSPGAATYSASGTPSAVNAGAYSVQFDGTGSYAGSSGAVGWTISKANQGLVSISPVSQTVSVGSGITFTASGGSTGNYSWAGSAGASGGGASKFVGFGSIGTFTVTVYDAGDGNHNASNTAVATITVTAISTSFTIAPTTFTYNGAAQGPTITPSPGGATYSVAGTASAIAVGAYSVTATANGSYTGTSGPVGWSIVKANQAAVAITSANSFVYGNSYTATAAGGSGTGSFVWGLGAGSTAANAAIDPVTGVVTASSTGTVVVHVYKAADANYNQSATTADFPISVTARPITVTLSGSKPYDGNTSAAGASAAITAGTLAAGDTVGYAYGATGSANAGGYVGLAVATISNASAPVTRTSSYAITYAGSYTISQVLLTVTANNASRTYGVANPGFTPSYSGFVGGDTSAVLSGAPSLATAATPSSPVGSYAIVAGAGTLSATNYSFSFVNGTLTIGKASLTVTANNASRAYGAANPGFTPSYSGFLNGDTSAVLTGSPALNTGATVSSPAGSYTITAAVGTLGSTNYLFSFANGTLTVTQATITVTANPATKVAGAANPSFTVSYSGFLNGDTSAVISGTPTFSTSATALSPVGAYPITASTGSLSAASYTFAFTGGTLTVTKATPTISFPAVSNTSAGSAAVLNASLVGGFSPSGSISYSVSGATGGAAASIAGSTLNVTSLGTGNPGTLTILATYGGDSNNFSATQTTTVSVPDQPPSGTATFPSTVNYGAAVTATGTVSDTDLNATSFLVEYQPPSGAWTTLSSGSFAATGSSSTGISHTPTSVGAWKYRITATDASGVASAPSVYTVTVNPAPTVTTATALVANAAANNFATDAITINGSTTSTVTGLSVAVPVYTIQSITNLTGASYGVGAAVPSPFTLGGIVTRPGGVVDHGETDAVSTVVILVSFAGNAQYQASQTTVTINLTNATYPSNLRIRAWPQDNMRGWLAPSPVSQDTYQIQRAR